MDMEKNVVNTPASAVARRRRRNFKGNGKLT
jgi:hypothetical protein